MRVWATFSVEERRELQLDMPDDGFTDGDLLEAARAVEPFTDFVAVQEWQEA
jgi:hypothetical protein